MTHGTIPLRVALLLFLLAGCGKRDDTPESPGDSPQPPVSAPATIEPSARGPGPEPLPPEEGAAPGAGTNETDRAAADTAEEVKAFEALVVQVLALENEADFTAALTLCRQARARFRERDQLRRLSAMTGRLIQARREAPELSYAVEKLGASRSSSAKVGANTLRRAGATGLIFLRLALRDKPLPVAANAAIALGEVGDTNAVPVMLERLVRDGDAGLCQAVGTALAEMLSHLAPAQFAHCRQLLARDEGVTRYGLAAVLTRLFADRCERDADRYNALFADPGAYDELRRYVEKLLTSGDQNMVRRACADARRMELWMNGFRARYFADTGFAGAPVLQRLEPLINYQVSRQFPYPDGQQDNLGIRWSGQLHVAQAGDYTFYMAADDTATLYIDGATVLVTPGWAERGAVAKLTAGTHAIGINYLQTTADSRIYLAWSGASIVKTHDLPVLAHPWPEAVLSLGPATTNLAAEAIEQRLPARHAIYQAGEIGRVFLRQAVRTADPAVARAAAIDLAERRDARTYPVLIERLLKEPADSPIVPALTRALRDLAATIDPRTCGELHTRFKAHTVVDMPFHAAALCGVLQQRCLGSETNFNALVGDENAYAHLSQHVREAARVADQAIVLRACEYGYPILSLIRGAHGRYYEGAAFDKLVHQRVETSINYYENRFPTPGNRQDKISARWSGYLDIEKAGDYRFHLRAENEGHIWVDDKLVVSGTYRGHEPSGVVKLEPGLHTFRALFREWQGEASMVIHWDGPDIVKQPLSSRWLRTHPWRDELLLLADDIRSLTSTNEATLVTAKGRIRRMDPVSRHLLRKALRDEPEPVALQAADMLIEVGDAEMQDALIARLEKDPTLRLTRSVITGLRGAASHLTPENARRLFDLMKADTEHEMSAYAAALCAALETVCSRDPAKFNEFISDGGAYDALQAYVGRALHASEPAIVQRAVAYGRPFVPAAKGIVGRYYEGYNHDKFLFERRDAHMWIDRGKFPHPAKRQDNVSVRWSGYVEVTTAGDYRFHAVARQRMKLWLDGALLMDIGHDAYSKPVKLDPGLHALRVEYRQGPGDRYIDIYWEGPGVSRQRLTDAVLRSVLPAAEIAELPGAVTSLASDDPAVIAGARTVFHRTDPPSREFLISALHHTPPEAVAHAVDLLVYRDEPRVAYELLDVVGKRPELATGAAVLDGLAAALRRIPPERFGSFTQRLREDKKIRMGYAPAILCNVLHILCNDDREAYDKLVGEHAAAALDAYMAKALVSADTGVLARACRYGAPYVAPSPGWDGRYFDGWDPTNSVLIRRDFQVYQSGRAFPHPDKRQDYVSATWTGLLDVPKDGEYTLRIAADDYGRLWLDGEPVLESRHPEVAKAVNLSAGVHSLRFDYHQVAANAYFWVQWEGPGIGRQNLAGNAVFSPATATELQALRGDVQALAGKPDVAGPARARLLSAGDPGLVFLRHALRHGPAANAGPAAELLATLQDGPAAAMAVERLRKDPKLLTAGQLFASLETLAIHIRPEDCKWIASATTLEDKPATRPWLAVLYAILEQQCAGDEKRYAELTGAPGLYGELKTLAEEALAADDPATVDWACEHTGSFAPLLRGCRGRYFEGMGFGKRVGEKRDPAPRIVHNQFPHTARERVSATWRGNLWVEKPGEYAFVVRADDGMRLWIDGRRVVDAWQYAAAQERWGKAQLERGWHTIHSAYWQNTAGNYAEVQWQGPGLARAALDAHLRTHAWPGETAALRKQVARLQSKNPAEMQAAKKTIDTYEDLGALFMRNALYDALRTGEPALAEPAAIALAGRRDLRAYRYLVGRLTAEKADSPIVPGLTRALYDLADTVDARTCASLYAQFKSHTKADIPFQAAALCGILRHRCNGSEAEFNTLVGDKGGHERLVQHIRQAIRSTDEATVVRACQYGYPVVPLLRGAHGRYYWGNQFEQLVLNRLETSINYYENRMPTPGKRQDQISARWDGYIDVPKDGDYKLYLRAENEGEVWVDEKLVVRGTTRGSEPSGTIKLSAGLHRFRASFREWSGAASMVIHWEGPDIKKQPLSAQWLRANPWRAGVEQLLADARNLASKTEAELVAAKARIREMDPVSRPVLRKALRDEAETIALEAAGMLTEMGDGAMQDALVARLREKPDLRLTPSVITGLRGSAPHLTTENASWLFGQMQADAAHEMSVYAAALCAALETACGGDQARFDKLVGKAAFAALRDHVGQALHAAEPDKVVRAVSCGTPFAAYARGMTGRYYEGYNYEKLVLERRDEHMWIDRNKFPHPANRQDNVSVRWDGFVHVGKAGDYRFHVGTRQKAQLWLDGRLLVDCSGNDGSGTAALTPGMHALRVAYQQSAGGDRRMDVHWEGPGIARQRLTDNVLRTAILPAEASGLPGAIDALGKPDLAAVGKARAAIHGTDPASREFLINALHHAPPNAIRHAVDLLAFRDEPRLGAELLAAVTRRPELATHAAVLDGLAAAVRRIPREQLAALDAGLLKDREIEVGYAPATLCRALHVQCNNDKKAYDTLVGDGAAARLDAYMAKAVVSADADVLVRVCRYGAPYVTCAMGWRARYFEGREPAKPVLDRIDFQIAQGNRMFPHPQNRQDNISAIWHGILDVPQKGKYTFRIAARDYGRLWLDGTPLIESRHQEAAAGQDLEAGIHTLRVDFSHGTSDSGCSVHWEGPNIGRQNLSGLWVRAPLSIAELKALRSDVQALPGNANVAGAARARLLAAGDAGRVFLRHALRHDPDAVAGPALELLAAMQDGAAAAMAVERLRKNPKAPLAGKILASLETLAIHVAPEDSRWLAANTTFEDKPETRPWLAVLYGILEQQCAGSAKQFTATVGVTEAHTNLFRLAQQGLVSADPKTVDWACEHTGPFAPLVRGCRGRYFQGAAFDQQVLERRDPAPRIGHNQFPHARQDNVSAAWSGRLWVEKPGDYAFVVRADDGARLWLDGRLVVDAWQRAAGQERRGNVTLAKGWHRLDCTYGQTTGDRHIEVQWQGPGMGRTSLDAHIWTHVWLSEAAALRAGIGKLGSENNNDVNQARQAIKAYQDLGRLFLRNALRYEKGRVLEQAARYLLELKEEGVPRMLVERIVASAEATAPAGTILATIPKELAPGDLSRFMELVAKDPKFERRDLVNLFHAVFHNVCGANADKFNAHVKTEGALDSLRDYVTRAAASPDTTVAAWAAKLTPQAPWKK